MIFSKLRIVGCIADAKLRNLKAIHNKKGVKVDVAVIYDKYHSYDRHAIEEGIKKFE